MGEKIREHRSDKPLFEEPKGWGERLARRAFRRDMVIKVVGFVMTAIVGGFLLQVYKTADWQNKRDIEDQRNRIIFQRDHFERISRDIERRWILSRRLAVNLIQDDVPESLIEKWDEAVLGWNERYHYYQLLLRTFVDRERSDLFYKTRDYAFRPVNAAFNYVPSSSLDRDCSLEKGGRCPFVTDFCRIKGVAMDPEGKAADQAPIDLAKNTVPACLSAYCAKRRRYFESICAREYEPCRDVGRKREGKAGEKTMDKSQKTAVCNTANFLVFLHKCQARTVGGPLSAWKSHYSRIKRGLEADIDPAYKAQLYADIMCGLSDLYVHNQRFYKVIAHSMMTENERLKAKKATRGFIYLMLESLFPGLAAQLEDDE